MQMKKILCLGGNGQLGKSVMKCLQPYNLLNVDYSPSEYTSNNLLLQQNSSPENNNKMVIEHLKKNNEQFDAIMVTAGGWVSGSIKDQDYFSKCENMFNVNLTPSLLAAHLATKHLAEYGLVVFTGAAAVFKEPQPDMIAYSMAKTGVHSVALNLTEQILTKGKDQTVITILPETIDTETNRQAMPKADHSKWAKPDHIGQLLRAWVDGLNTPNNGSFAVLKVKNGTVYPQFV